MKLKKLLALALAGVMAVSMLAGCKDNGGNNNNGGEKEPTVSGAASILNKVVEDVTFEDGNAAYLNVALKVADVEKLEKDSITRFAVGNVPSAITNAMSKEEYDAVIGNFNTAFTSPVAAKDDVDETKTVFFAIDAEKVISTEDLMIKVGSAANLSNLADTVTVRGGDTYMVDYEGVVSVKQFTATDSDGDSHSAYVVVLTVTRTAGDAITVGNQT